MLIILIMLYIDTKFGENISKGRLSYRNLCVLKMAAAAILNLLPVTICII